MRTLLALALAAWAGAWAGPWARYAAAEDFRIGDWEGRAVGEACVATTRQAQGTVLTLRLERSGALVVLAANPHWTTPLGRSVGLLFAFDNRARQSTSGRVVGAGTLRLELADPAAFAAALRGAHDLQVYSAGAAASFRLADAGAVLDRLASCSGAAPVARDAEPASPDANRLLADNADGGAARPFTPPTLANARLGAARWPAIQREFAPMQAADLAGLPLTPPDIERLARQSVHLLWVDPTDKGQWNTVGSAVAISSDTLVTNCHLVRDSRRLWLRQGARSATPVLLAAHDDSDRCFIRVEGFPLTPVPGVRTIASLQVGEAVYSLGNPGGHDRVFGAGRVTALRQREGMTVVQTTAPMSPGSSGGGLFDAHGNLVGVTSFRLINAGRASGGYAIAAEEFWR